ncbi:DUF362 domain-containing protein [bacterium]|nr:DUF362 domain-containing protein [bacterium]
MSYRLLVLSLGLLAGVAAAAEPSRVVTVTDAAAIRGVETDTVRVQAMVSAGLQKITGTTDAAAAWRALGVASNDVVGIKISTQTGPLQATRPAVVAALAAGLRAAGVASTNIIVWDRYPAALRAAGYELTTDQADGRPPAVSYVVRAVVGDTGWDPAARYESRTDGKLIWGDLLFGRADTDLSNVSHYPRLLSQRLTKLVNVPVLQDHENYGLMGCVANLSAALVDNSRRFESFGRGDPEMAEIAASPLLWPKTVLHVLDALLAGYAGGPKFKLQYAWPCGRLYLSRDPVAVDALALALLEEKRAAAKVPPIGPAAVHVAAAARAGLGEGRVDQIEVVEVAAGRDF